MAKKSFTVIKGKAISTSPARRTGAAPEEMLEGTVNWFDSQLGYGFITPDDLGVDVFVHYRAIQSDCGHKTLVDGQRVSLLIARNSERGLMAREVIAHGQPASPAPSLSAEDALAELARLAS